MKKLILVRYGEWQDRHLTEVGVETMQATAKRLKALVQGLSLAVIAADVSRAIESAEVIAKFFNVPSVQKFTELFAAVEDGRPPDPAVAMNIVSAAGEKYDVVVTVVSREYIEILPSYIFEHSFGIQSMPITQLDRGEVLIIDFEAKEIVKM